MIADCLGRYADSFSMVPSDTGIITGEKTISCAVHDRAAVAICSRKASAKALAVRLIVAETSSDTTPVFENFIATLTLASSLDSGATARAHQDVFPAVLLATEP